MPRYKDSPEVRATKQERREKLRELLALMEVEDVRDLKSVFKEMVGEVLENGLEAELDDNLGYTKYDYRNKDTDNSRNGHSVKTVKTSAGEVEIAVPRDRKTEFEPQIIRKNETSLSWDIEEKIISMYAKGMTTNDISAHIEDIYGIEVSDSLVSRITDKILPVVKEWQQRPLESIYAVVFMDAIRYNVRCEGRIDSRVDRLLNSIKFVNDIAELKAYDSAKIVTDGKENGNIHYCVKNMPNGEMVYYLVNLSNEEQTVMFSVKGKVPLGNWDISLDKLSPVKFDYIDNFTVAELKFSPYGSYILKNSKAEFNTHSAKEIISLNNIFEVTDCSPNALTLDTCEYRIDGGEWQPEKAIILLQNELLQLRHQCDVDLKFSFTVEDGTVLNNLNLCIETPEKYKFTLNGTKIDFADNGYFTDNKIRSMSILPFIKKGVNEIVLSVKFYQNDNVYRVLFTKGIHETELNKLTYDTELESIYLTGDFGVHMDGEYRYGERRCIYGGRNFKITNRKKKLDISKITEQDYWFLRVKSN